MTKSRHQEQALRAIQAAFAIEATNSWTATAIADTPFARREGISRDWIQTVLKQLVKDGHLFRHGRADEPIYIASYEWRQEVLFRAALA